MTIRRYRGGNAAVIDALCAIELGRLSPSGSTLPGRQGVDEGERICNTDSFFGVSGS